jgi:hypothetical protein
LDVVTGIGKYCGGLDPTLAVVLKLEATSQYMGRSTNRAIRREKKLTQLTQRLQP